MTPQYDLVPGESVGDFKLGDSLWQTLEYLRTTKAAYPKAEVSWDVTKPHKSAVVIHLPHVTLFFPYSSSQTLSRITIADLRSLLLRYDSHVLSSPGRPGVTLTRGLVGKVLGPTYASTTSSGELVYPGLSFHLRAAQSGEGQTEGSNRLEVVERITVSPKGKGGEDVVEVKGLRLCEVIPGRGVTLTFGSSNVVQVIIGETTAQDIMLDLGSPIRRFWKEDQRMERMWGDQTQGIRGGTDSQPLSSQEWKDGGGEYFLNYFQYGLDLLVSADGIVQKVIAYSNIPGTPLFQRYAKCPWVITTSHGNLDSTSSISSFSAALQSSSSSTTSPPVASHAATSHLDIPTTSRPATSKQTSKKRTGSATSSHSATSNTSDTSGKDGEVRNRADLTQIEGMMLDRLGEGGLEGVLGDMTSRLVGFDGLVVEEDLASGGISSVLVFRDSGVV